MAVNIKKDFNNDRARKPNITSLVYGKVPPQAPELEEAVLGAVLLEKNAIDTVLEILPTPDHFYVDANQKIYESIVSLHKKGMPIDLLTVTEELRKHANLEIIGGAYYLTRLTMGVVSAANIETHARIVKEKYMSRLLIQLNASSLNDCYEDSSDIFDLLSKAEKGLNDIQKGIMSKDVTSIKAVMKEVLDQDEAQRESKQEFTGVPTGNSDLDSCTGGWQKGDLIILAARPAVGKTAKALDFIQFAGFQGFPSALFSLEMKNVQLVRRLLSASSGVEFKKILFPARQTAEEIDIVRKHAVKLANTPIFLDDTHSLTFRELRGKARKLKLKHDIQLLVIDYLQLMQGDSGDSWNREGEIAKISRDLKGLAKELDIPIIALCQLNRAVESRKVRGYKLSDLRESGAIEQDADIVAFLHVPSAEDFADKAGVALHTAGLFIEKHRNGECKKIPYIFEKSIQRWSEYTNTPKSAAEKKQPNASAAPQADNKSKAANDKDDDLPF